MKFYKDTDNKWYVDLPEWTGEKWELEMVFGADTMLEIAAQGEDVVHLSISIEKPEADGANTLTKIRDTPDVGGALYLMKEFRGHEYNLEVWLCHVTSFVFGSLPETIYIY